MMKFMLSGSDLSGQNHDDQSSGWEEERLQLVHSGWVAALQGTDTPSSLLLVTSLPLMYMRATHNLKEERQYLGLIIFIKYITDIFMIQYIEEIPLICVCCFVLSYLIHFSISMTYMSTYIY